MPMRVILITTCSSRKKLTPLDNLHASSLPEGTQDDVCAEWARRIDNVPGRIQAKYLYCGRAFSEIKNYSNTANEHFYIISAGLGLIKSNSFIPPYNLTVTGVSQDNVAHRVIGEDFSYSRWWVGVNEVHGHAAPLANLIRTYPNCLFVIAISSSYWKLINSDLIGLSQEELTRVRIAGLSRNNLPAWIHDSLLPYDERFDGPLSPRPGTRSDFPQRVSVHYVKEIFPKSNAENDSEYVLGVLQKMTYKKSIRRVKLESDSLLDLMCIKLKTGYVTSSQMLRWLRDEKFVSCEQGRCGRLYKIAVRSFENES